MLPKLEFKSTRDKPHICFDSENNIFEISGKSYPEDSMKFFGPICDWIIEYVKKPNQLTHVVCKLEYFNSSSAKMLYEVFYEFEKIIETDCQMKVSWYYEKGDKLIEEKGLEFKSILELPFKLIEID